MNYDKLGIRPVSSSAPLSLWRTQMSETGGSLGE
ncbi:hypothetical protein BVRB_5g118510 [Beta vulgaris subsp. vulgaris]|nr:hypothetical protein BVRB_5g118510 [Beta vulgaris subsp. vulgaris]